MDKLWDKLIGYKQTFNIEVRIFHSVCIWVAFAIGVNVPYNFYMGLYIIALLMASIVFGIVGIYYLSRLKRKSGIALILFQVLNHLLLLAIYYYNSGAHGPCYAMYIVSFFISVVIVPKQQYRVWLPLNIVTILCLFYYEAVHPDWIMNSYTDQSARFFDFGFTYFFIAGTIFIVAVNIRNAYHEEHTNALEKTRILLETNHTKDKLLSVLAHDIKEPLASVQGFLELLVDYQLNDTERVDIERQLLNRTKDTSYLLTNVLAWTKGQMDAVEVKVSSLNLRQTLDNTLKLVQSIAEEKHLAFDYQIDSELCIVADKDLMQLIVRNLAINAVKFTYPGGRIAVHASIEAARCSIQISDTGSGIPIAKQSNIFSLNASSTFGTNKEKGAGLGLVLCKEFTEMQGGHISFTSQENKGSTFYVSMPLCDNFNTFSN